MRVSRKTARPRAPAARPAARRRSGMAMAAGLLLLAVLTTLAVAVVTSTGASIRQADNLAKVQRAQLQTESGLAYVTSLMARTSLPGQATGQDVLDGTASSLAARLDGSGTLGGDSVVYDGNTILIPSITLGSAGERFTAAITLDGNSTLRLAVTGHSGSISRSAGMTLRLVEGSRGFFDYGIASKGKITMTGNAEVRGANDPSEANILAGTYSDDEAIALTGNCCIEGDISISNPDGYADLTGNVSVGGEGVGGDIDEHVHTGVGPAEFPEVDPTVFEPFATNVVDSSTSTSGNKTFENIRILANTNKTFAGNITLKGVIYIEQPNRIKFSGNLDITGVVVTEDAGDDDHESNTLKFTGNTNVRGLDYLPDDPQFADLKQMPGAFLLAPGFGTEFAGNFGTISGCMAADRFKFTGNAGGTVKGGVINYGDTELKLTGNSSLTIDRSDSPEVPPGFSTPATLSPVADSYIEY